MNIIVSLPPPPPPFLSYGYGWVSLKHFIVLQKLIKLFSFRHNKCMNYKFKDPFFSQISYVRKYNKSLFSQVKNEVRMIRSTSVCM